MVQRNLKQEKFSLALCGKAALLFTALFCGAQWALYRGVQFIPAMTIAIDCAASAFILSLLAAFFAEWGVQRGIKSGKTTALTNEKKSIFAGRPLVLGALLGLAAGGVFLPSLIILFKLFGLEGQSFAQFMAFKLVCASSLGFLMTSVAVQHSLRR